MNFIVIIPFFLAITSASLIDDHFGVLKNRVLSANRLKDIANFVNNKPHSTWEARTDIVGDVDMSRLVGTLQSTPPSLDAAPSKEDRANNCENNGLPKQFDARKKWSKCKSISHIYDQGNCGSCWAVSVTSAFSDRICIATDGKKNAIYSNQQMLSCCHKCAPRNGCDGGWPIAAWAYIQRNGMVTGGDFNSTEGCQPYLHPPCAHHVNGTSLPLCSDTPEKKAPHCKLCCYNKLYSTPYKTDRVKAKSFYNVNPCSAQNEIYNHGPIVATFAVYEDFYTYKSGVYQYTTGKLVGYHAVRVVGWGEENNEPYWLVANSWNSDWGDKGMLKIIRGIDECWFEEGFSAGKL